MLLQLTSNDKLLSAVIVGLVVAGGGYYYWKKSAPVSSVGEQKVSAVRYRNLILKDNVKQLVDSKSCASVADKPLCLSNFLKSNNGIQFGTDLGLFNAAVRSICSRKDLNCIFESMDQVLAALDSQRIKNNVEADLTDGQINDLADFYRTQMRFVRSFLLNHRKLITTAYTTATPTDQSKYLTYIKSIDQKLLSLPADKLTSEK